MGTDVVAAVLDFMHSSTMPSDINYTHIVLIPKVPFSLKLMPGTGFIIF